MNKIFDLNFIKQNMMGPNCVKLLTELISGFQFRPGSRILDLGCGCGLTSIQLAHKYDVRVFAQDLWISAADNYSRFEKGDLGDKIIPIHADVHDRIFAEGYFDAVISVDAYHYFGTEDGFLDQYIAPLLKPDGFIAIAVPGLKQEFSAVPDELLPYWQENMNFHSAGWWYDLFSKSELCHIVSCKSLKSHEEAWNDWLLCDNPYAKRDIEMLKAEGGRYFDTIGIIAVV